MGTYGSPSAAAASLADEGLKLEPCRRGALRQAVHVLSLSLGKM
jgi:hypothetical protein